MNKYNKFEIKNEFKKMFIYKYIEKMEKDKLAKYLTCPITKLILCDPVLADDGHFYEYMAIKNHLLKSNISIINGKKMENVLIRSPHMKKLVDDFIEGNPEYKNDQFLFKKPFYLFSKEFIDSLREKEFDKLKEFTSIVLNTDIGRESLFELICKNCPDDIIKLILDNSIDYDVFDRKKLKPLHIACKYASGEIIMYLAKKGVDLESDDITGERALSYIVLYKTPDIYKNFIGDFLNLGVDINFINKNGYSTMHHLVNNGDLETFKLFISNNYNMNTTSHKLGGLNILQYVFRYSTNQDLIKYVIDLNVNLDIDIDPKTTCEQLIYQNENLNKKQKQQLVLQYLTKILSKPVIVDNFVDNVNK